MNPADTLHDDDPFHPGERAHPGKRALQEHAGVRARSIRSACASTHAQGDAREPRTGADVSHRGSRPGFTRIEYERTLLVPDFAGNGMFMTLGNIHVDPREGLQWSPATLRTGVWPEANGQARVQDPARDARTEDGGSRG